MKRLGPISSSLCVVHIIGRRVSGNQDQNLCQDRSLRLQTIVEQSHKLAWRFLSMPREQLGYAAAFVSAGVIIITSVLTGESLCGSPPPPDATGLYHLSILRF
jgi:hypothetical protein